MNRILIYFLLDYQISLFAFVVITENNENSDIYGRADGRVHLVVDISVL